MDLKGKLSRLTNAGPGSRTPVLPTQSNKNDSEREASSHDVNENENESIRQKKLERLRSMIQEVMTREPSPSFQEITDIKVRSQSLPGSLKRIFCGRAGRPVIKLRVRACMNHLHTRLCQTLLYPDIWLHGHAY